MCGIWLPDSSLLCPERESADFRVASLIPADAWVCNAFVYFYACVFSWRILFFASPQGYTLVRVEVVFVPWLMGFVSVTELRSTQLIREVWICCQIFHHAGCLTIQNFHSAGSQVAKKKKKLAVTHMTQGVLVVSCKMMTTNF